MKLLHLFLILDLLPHTYIVLYVSFKCSIEYIFLGKQFP